MTGFAACTVVKLGGSLLAAGPGQPPPVLATMRTIAAAGRHAILVPGGGHFADGVRDSQRRLGFSDHAAHTMALHAMVQTGLALVDLTRADGRFELLGTPDCMAEALARGAVPLWHPLPMASAAADIGCDWSVTSDALAAWLALELGARAVILVKSCAVPDGMDAAALAAAGIVDSAFARIVGGGALPWHVLHHSEREALVTRLGP